MDKLKNFFNPKNDVRGLTLILSLLISIFILNTWNPPIQVDGIKYIHTANVYLQHGFHAALQYFNWPFYSILIAVVSQLLHLSLEHAANCVDTLGVILLTFSFVNIIQQMNASLRVQIFAMIIILIFPGLNITQKTPVLRDFMYWGLLFASLSCFFHYLKTFKCKHACAFGLLALASGLFRTEGVLIAYSLPLIILSFKNQTWKKRWLYLFKAWSLQILILIIAIIFHFSHTGTESRIGYFAGMLQNIQGLTQHAITTITTQIFSLQEQRATLAAGSMIFFGFIGIIFVSCIKLSSYLFALMNIHAMCKNQMPSDHYIRRSIGWLLFIYTVILMLFLFSNYFIADRYFMGLILAWLLFAPFSLESLTQGWRKSHIKIILLPIVILIMIYLAFHGLYRAHYSKAYITKLGQWVATHTPKNANVYSSDPIVLYYSKRQGTNDGLTILKNTFQHYHVIAVRFGHHDKSKAALWIKAYGQPSFITHGPNGAIGLVFQK